MFSDLGFTGELTVKFFCGFCFLCGLCVFGDWRILFVLQRLCRLGSWLRTNSGVSGTR